MPSRQSICFFALAVVLFFISLSYSHNLSLAVAAVFICSLLVSAVYTNFNLTGVEICGLSSFDGHHGEACIVVRLLNKKNRKKFDVEVWAEGHQCKESVSLSPGQVIEVLIPLDLSRGIYHFRRFKLKTTFPFGVFVAWRSLPVHSKVWVYPKALDCGLTPQMEARKNVAGKESLGGLRGSDEFVGHKRYQAGDSWKSIDWKAWARERGLLRKVFETPSGAAEIFDFSTLRLKDGERKLEQIAWWLARAERRGSVYKLIMPEQEIDFGQGEVHLRNCLRTLSSYGREEKAA